MNLLVNDLAGGCSTGKRIKAIIPGCLGLIVSLPLHINLRTLCPLGDAACGPIDSALQKFRHEFEHHIAHRTCFTKDARLTMAAVP